MKYFLSQFQLLCSGDSFNYNVNGLSPHARKLYDQVVNFIKDEIRPVEAELTKERNEVERWTTTPEMEMLKEKAKSKGLWNLFIPKQTGSEVKYGRGLTHLEYAFICEQMRKISPGPEMFNCSAPDTGNMGMLIKYGTEQQKSGWNLFWLVKSDHVFV